MKKIAIIQARCSSTRLANKVLKKILDKPMLQWQVERVQLSRLIDELVIATSFEESDDDIEVLCNNLSVNVFRGSLADVLDRYYQAATLYQADIIIRITGDCPLIDSDIIDQVIAKHISSSNDYTSNIEPETFPDGLDVEVFNYQTLKNAWIYAKKKSEREHVTPYIRNNQSVTKGTIQSATDYSHYRWTVDEEKDFEFVTQIYQKLGCNGEYFGADKIYQLLQKQPELLAINQNITRNEGLLKSIQEDNI